MKRPSIKVELVPIAGTTLFLMWDDRFIREVLLLPSQIVWSCLISVNIIPRSNYYKNKLNLKFLKKLRINKP